MLFYFIILVSQPVVTIHVEDIFQPLQRTEVIVRPDGIVYVLDFQEAVIREFGSQGDFIRTIGAKGKGPGEFVYPTRFFFRENRLYVYDVLSSDISVFDEKGVFLSRIHTGYRGISMCKTQHGWVYFKWNTMDVEDIEVYRVDESFSNPVKLISFKHPGYQRGFHVITHGKDTKAEYSPVSGEPSMRVSGDGNRVFLAHGEEPTIYLIDDAKSTITSTWRLKLKRIPFDLDWAREKLREIKEEAAGQVHVKIQTHFPDHFPAFRDMIVGPDGVLALNRWVGRPDDHNYPLFLDQHGKETKSRFTWETLDRLVGMHGDTVYLTYWDQEADSGGVVGVPSSEANTYVSQYPIEFDGAGGRSISISN
jgi:hypothetical protein